ncbi:MAG: PIG-L family deacetylase [Verrucomicrobiota bacterium]|jgi:LmbE family N-acetylglucosaminyl deacetylase|nr:PIG-L family deacetylase [Verrucomicrobiota bacterium]
MHFSSPSASIYVPPGQTIEVAVPRITHLGIGAHQDDLEFMAFHGIEACYRQNDKWFGGVTCTNGAGSSRTGLYKGYSDDEMCAVRRREQEQAAVVGEYAAMVQLDYPSSSMKDPSNPSPVEDLLSILEATRPEVVYTHNPADKHATHVAVTAAVLKALRALPPEAQPRQVLGCEVWRDLDWMLDADKTVLDVSGRPNLAAAIGGIFDSQIAGGKRYDLAVQGRRLANATFFDSHSVDDAEQLWFAMDLTPLVDDPTLDPVEFTAAFIRRFEEDVRGSLGNYF